MDEKIAPETPGDPALITWGVAGRPLPGEATSGDLSLVKPVPTGVLVAVLDGLGHGEEAAMAAQRAAHTIEHWSPASPDAPGSLMALVTRCHQELKDTRGVVMSLALFQEAEATLTWLGVGNVEGVLYRASASAAAPSERLQALRGVVGYKLPRLRASGLAVGEGDTLLLATDGIRAEFAEGSLPPGSPQQIADRILAQFVKGSDDALVLVVRYLGAGNGDPVERTRRAL
jgi:serine/threonine protein phosphatase PrpC